MKKLYQVGYRFTISYKKYYWSTRKLETINITPQMVFYAFDEEHAFQKSRACYPYWDSKTIPSYGFYLELDFVPYSYEVLLIERTLIEVDYSNLNIDIQQLKSRMHYQDYLSFVTDFAGEKYTPLVLKND